MTMMNRSSKSRRPLTFMLLGVLLVLVVGGAVGVFAVLNGDDVQAKTHPGTHAYQPKNIKNLVDGPSLSAGTQPSALESQDNLSLNGANKTVNNLLKRNIKMSGGGCLVDRSYSRDANIVTASFPYMYGYENSNAPMIGLLYDWCKDQITVKISREGYDYYKVNWWRPGRNGWSQYKTSISTSIFSNVHPDTYYQFTVEGCFSHWYGDSCKSWSPRVNTSTAY